MSQAQFNKMQTRGRHGPTNIYRELFTSNQTSEPEFCEINSETQRTIIPSDATDRYEVAIERMMLNTKMLPQWVPNIASSYNLTDLKIAINYGDVGNDASDHVIIQPLIWEQSSGYGDSLPSSAPTPYETYIEGSDVYYLNSLYAFLDMINKAIYNGLYDLDALTGKPTGWSLTGVGHILNVGFDSGTSKFYYMGLSNYYSEATTVVASGGTYNGSPIGPIKVAFNAPLMRLLSGFRYYTKTNYAYSTEPTEDFYMLRMYHDGDPYNTLTTGLVTATLTRPFSYTADQVIRMDQDQASLSNFAVATKIIVTSNLPIQSQLMSDAYKWDGEFVKSDTKILPVLGDISIIPDDYNFSNHVLNYVPTHLRYNDLVPNRDISDIHIKIFWMDLKGNLHRLRLPPGGYANVMLHFHKI